MSARTESSKATSGRLNYSDYHNKRLHNPVIRFSLRCRIEAISRSIEELFPYRIERILDLGSADGLLAKGIFEIVPGIKRVYAVDMDSELLKFNPFLAVEGDCRYLPFADSIFDVLTAAALIEHFREPKLFLKECHRILKPGGMIFLTCPVPFFELIATKIGYLKDSGHVARYNLADIRKLSEGVGFQVVAGSKFMFSPFDLPGYLHLESFLRKIGLSFFMLNQLCVCRKEAIE